jgi:trans-aconitate 2-methyltransferase
MLRLPLCLRNINGVQSHVINKKPFQRAMSSQASSTTQKDWSADQYLKFNTLRTRPVRDLVNQITPFITSATPQIYDLGCGPGNSTEVLQNAFPDAKIAGMDSSTDMLKRARSTLPNVEFVQGDLATYSPDKAPDLLFSNAVFHWLRTSTRIPTLLRLFQTLKPGGVLAIQMPDNYHEPSHAAMRDAATLPSKPWSQYFAHASVGNLQDPNRPDLDPIEPSSDFYNALVPHAAHVDIWRTTYSHILADAPAIVEWVKGTGLQPFTNLIEDGEAKKAYLKEYEGMVRERYAELGDGKVFLEYPRFFVFAVKK